jgi:hypothetical protein
MLSPEAEQIYGYFLDNGHVGRDHAIRLSDIIPDIPFLRACKRPDVVFHNLKDELLDNGLVILGDAKGRYIPQSEQEIIRVWDRMKEDAIHRLVTCGKLYKAIQRRQLKLL